jgi:rare lipoprotein A
VQVEIALDLVDGRQRSRVFVGNFGDRPEAEAVRQRLLVWGIGGLVREVALR